MNVNITFKFCDNKWGPSATFTKYFEKIRARRPDIKFTYFDSGLLRKSDPKYHGNSCRFSPFYMYIENADNKKFILVSFWGRLREIFDTKFNYGNMNLDLMQELITSTGVINDDIEFKPIDNLKYTPFGYVSYTSDHEVVADKLYNLNLPKKNPEKPIFRNYPNDPFRKYLFSDNRFNCIDRTNQNSTISTEEFMKELNASKINISINGNSEICHRDVEILSLGNVLMRTKFVLKFNEPLIPDYHYIAIDVDDYKDHKTIADKMINKYNEIKDNTELLNFIGKNAREWYLKNGSTEGCSQLLLKLIDYDKLL